MGGVGFAGQTPGHPPLPYLLDEHVHAVLVAWPPEDALVVEEGLHVGDELQKDQLTAGRDGSSQSEGGCGFLTVWTVQLGGREITLYLSIVDCKLLVATMQSTCSK